MLRVCMYVLRNLFETRALGFAICLVPAAQRVSEISSLIPSLSGGGGEPGAPLRCSKQQKRNTLSL